jgi:hypothetical protein
MQLEIPSINAHNFQRSTVLAKALALSFVPKALATMPLHSNQTMFACLIVFLLLLSTVEGFTVRVLPVSEAVGAAFVFHLEQATTMIAFVTMIANHFGIDEASRIVLLFGGRVIRGAVELVTDIPGFREGFTLHLHVVRDPAVPEVQAEVQAVVQVPPPLVQANPGTAIAARIAYYTNWERIAGYVIESNPAVDPNPPDVFERNYILTVAAILTFNVPGVVNLRGVPGEFHSNLILAIMYYYRQKGRPALRETFLEGVYESL